MLNVRSYIESDYPAVVALYKQGKLYGGQFDEDRDSPERLSIKIRSDGESILVAEDNGSILGTVSILEDKRTAWLFRFAASNDAVTRALYDKAVDILKTRGHRQVLVYSPVADQHLNDRYSLLGFTKGEDYTAFWREI
jgi:hypothetical protein